MQQRHRLSAVAVTARQGGVGIGRVGLVTDRRQHHQRHPGVERARHQAVECDQLQALGGIDASAHKQRGKGRIAQRGHAGVGLGGVEDAT